jgi:hypothetical protein
MKLLKPRPGTPISRLAQTKAEGFQKPKIERTSEQHKYQQYQILKFLDSTTAIPLLSSSESLSAFTRANQEIGVPRAKEESRVIHNL